MNVFFARSMTLVPELHREEYADGLASIVEHLKVAKGWSVTWGVDSAAPIDRSGRKPSEMMKLYSWYADFIAKADLLIADVTFPSLGVGIELQIACQNSVRTWLITNGRFTPRTNVSMMALGVPGVEKTIEYTAKPNQEILRQFDMPH